MGYLLKMERNYFYVVTYELDPNIVGSEFELHYCYYIHFQTNTIAKGMNAFMLPSHNNGIDSTTNVSLQKSSWH